MKDQPSRHFKKNSIINSIQLKAGATTGTSPQMIMKIDRMMMIAK